MATGTFDVVNVVVIVVVVVVVVVIVVVAVVVSFVDDDDATTADSVLFDFMFGGARCASSAALVCTST